MAKLSISVPDELWSEAQSRLGPQSKPSELVQEVLREALREREERENALAHATVDPEGVQAAVEALREQALELFGEGYAAGLEFAGLADLDLLEYIGRTYGFNLLRATNDGLLDGPGYEGFLDGLGEQVDELTNLGPSELFHEGLQRSLRDVWETLRREIRTAKTGPRATAAASDEAAPAKEDE